MTAVDIGIILIIFASSVISVFRGFIKELVSVVTWVLAIVVTLMFTERLAGQLARLFDNADVRSLIAAFILFFATLFVGALVSYLLSRFVKIAQLTVPDRLLGAIFGVVRGFLIVSVIVSVAGLTPIPNENWWSESKLLGRFTNVAIAMRDRLPASLSHYLVYPRF